MELIIKIWRFGIFPTEIYHKNLMIWILFFLGNLANLGHLSMKNPFYRRKLHGISPKFFLNTGEEKWRRSVCRRVPLEESPACTARERNKQIRSYDCGRACGMKNVNGRRIAAHSQAHYWLAQATPVFLKKIRQRNKYFRSLGYLILSASSACRISGYVLPRAHNKTLMQRNGSCFLFLLNSSLW
jgi:hypothetical protein